MKHFSFTSAPGVICGQENNPDLFIRKVIFEKGYSEQEFHNHPNSYEFYIVLDGILTFANETNEISAHKGSIIYFEEAEHHKITNVIEATKMLLIKRVGSLKS